MTNKVTFYASIRVCKIRDAVVFGISFKYFILDDSYDSRLRNVFLSAVFTGKSGF